MHACDPTQRNTHVSTPSYDVATSLDGAQLMVDNIRGAGVKSTGAGGVGVPLHGGARPNEHPGRRGARGAGPQRRHTPSHRGSPSLGGEGGVWMEVSSQSCSS